MASGTAHSSDCAGAYRFPPLHPAENNLDATQLVEYDYLVNITIKTYGNSIITKDADGSLQGPFNVLLYTPTIAELFVNYQLGVASLLIPSEAEAATLGVLSVTKFKYGIYAHTIIAQIAGYTAEQVSSMIAGNSPEDILPRQHAIYRLAKKLATTRGPLDGKSFEEAVAVLGRRDLAAATQQTAAFMIVCIMGNVGDVCLPAGVKE